jgi:C-terminal processing protease CtpA/Prc
MVALICSYLFGAEPVHLNDLHWRDGKGERVEEFWTLKEVAGKRYAGKDVYVLTSGRTFSGAEEFSYNLKNLKRATLVGETTGGGANPGGGNRLSAHFAAFIPTGRAVSPVTKTNWEGTGVEPDVKVPADQALRTAQVMALKKAAERTTDEELKRAIQREIDSLQKETSQATAKQ